MRMTLIAALLTTGIGAGMAHAQPAPAPAPATTPAPATASPEALALAREVVSKTAGDRAATLASISGPMVGMMQQMGAKAPGQAQALVTDVIMPMLSEHYESLVDMQAQAYANALTVDDLKATSAFYNTKAGQDLIAAGPKLSQARLQMMGQWIASMQPEMNAKMQAFMKDHPDLKN